MRWAERGGDLVSVVSAHVRLRLLASLVVRIKGVICVHQGVG
jgi:hypothetical protein